jgi:hypothetical protein
MAQYVSSARNYCARTPTGDRLKMIEMKLNSGVAAVRCCCFGLWHFARMHAWIVGLIWVHMNCLVVAQVCHEVYSIALKSRVYFVLFLVWARCLIGWRSAADKASPHTYGHLGLIQLLLILQKTPYILSNFYEHIFLILQNIACV